MKKNILVAAAFFLASTAHADNSCRILSGDHYDKAISKADTGLHDLQSLLQEVVPLDSPLIKEFVTGQDRIFARAMVGDLFGDAVSSITHQARGESVADAVLRLRRAAVKLEAQLKSPKASKSLPPTLVVFKNSVIFRIDDFLNASYPLLKHFDCVYLTWKQRHSTKPAKLATGETGGYCTGPMVELPADQQLCVLPEAEVSTRANVSTLEPEESSCGTECVSSAPLVSGSGS